MSIARALIRHSRPNSLGKHSALKLVKKIQLAGSMLANSALLYCMTWNQLHFPKLHYFSDFKAL